MPIVEAYDILVAGAGPVGLTAGLACARRGFRTCVVGRIDRRDMGRTVALMEGSLRLYASLCLASELTAASSPLERMRIADDTDSMFRSRPVEFRADEIGLEAFGRNVESRTLIALLEARAAAARDLTLIEGFVEGYDFREDGVRARIEGGAMAAKLLVAADGLNSPARTAAGIEARHWTYDQTALTAILAHDRPHHDVSTEIHTRGGPFTLVPLPASELEPHRSSLVWMMKPRDARRRAGLPADEFALEAERQAHALLGRMRLASPVGAAPMIGMRAENLTGRRLILAGEAAHAFPPIGAQGLNLGLRDVRDLVVAIAQGPDPGAPEILRTYRRKRGFDASFRTLAVDLVNRSLPTATFPTDFARGFSLLALATFGPLRRAAMRVGIGPLGRETAGPSLRRLDAQGRLRP